MAFLEQLIAILAQLLEWADVISIILTLLSAIGLQF